MARDKRTTVAEPSAVSIDEVGEGAGMLEEADSDARTSASIQALEGGGLPVSARDRLADTDRPGAAWTSDLSVGELVAVRGAGFTPLGLVMGSSVYHIGAQWGYGYYGANAGGFSSVWYCPHGYHDDMRTGYNWEHTLHERGMVAAPGPGDVPARDGGSGAGCSRGCRGAPQA